MKKTLQVLLLSLWISVPLHADNIVFPPESGAINVKTAYGAKGDGKTDDTAAIQKAIDENKGKTNTIYFPDGVYLLSDRVGMVGGKAHSSDRFLAYQGQNEKGTILRLRTTPRPSGTPPNRKSCSPCTTAREPATACTAISMT